MGSRTAGNRGRYRLNQLGGLGFNLRERGATPKETFWVQCEVARRCLLRGFGVAFRDCRGLDPGGTDGRTSISGNRNFIGTGAVSGCHDSGRMVAVTAGGGFSAFEWDRSIVRQNWGQRERQRESIERIASATFAVVMLVALCSCFFWILVNNPHVSGSDQKPRPRPEMMAPKEPQPHHGEQSQRVAYQHGRLVDGNWEY
jgi:hypothetical protein